MRSSPLFFISLFLLKPTIQSSLCCSSQQFTLVSVAQANNSVFSLFSSQSEMDVKLDAPKVQPPPDGKWSPHLIASAISLLFLIVLVIILVCFKWYVYHFYLLYATLTRYSYSWRDTIRRDSNIQEKLAYDTRKNNARERCCWYLKLRRTDERE